jgi:MOSC domain-containing protein YiiM
VQGTIVQVSISRGGIPKLPVPEASVGPLGLEGDSHAHPQIHGGPDQAVLIVTLEGIQELTGRGYALFPGALGENLTVRGLDRRDLRVGQQIRAGSALLEISKPRGPCATLDVYGGALKAELKTKDPSSRAWGLSGFYTRVLSPGIVRPGDIIEVVATLA